MSRRLWKCRAVEAVENRPAVSHRSHRPWKSRCDFHIPTATTNPISLSQNPKKRKETRLKRNLFLQAHSWMRKC